MLVYCEFDISFGINDGHVICMAENVGGGGEGRAVHFCPRPSTPNIVLEIT